MNRKVLFVDDQPMLLNAYQRQLRKQYEIEVASDGPTGIQMIEEEGPFAAVVSDLRMPGMNGVEFLAKARDVAPKTVRVMLTGHADFEVATAAVNEGYIFRFLAKPCPPKVMTAVLDAAIEHHRLETAESVLLEETLSGCIHVLTEILSLVNPTAFGHSSRIERCVKHMTSRLELDDQWRFGMAAMLSQIGCVNVPPETLRKVWVGDELLQDEQTIYGGHPAVGASLVGNIPYLESVAQMVANQSTPLPDPESADEADDEDDDDEDAILGGQMIRLAIEFDQLMARHMSADTAIASLRLKRGYPPELLEALDGLDLGETGVAVKSTRVSELSIGMVLDQDVVATNGLVLVARGQEVTPTVLNRLHNFALGVGVVEPIRVQVPRKAA